MRSRLLIAAVLVLLGPAGALAADAVAPPPFPPPACVKPEGKLIEPSTDSAAPILEAYNARVKRFNQQAHDYDACVHAYVDASDAEIKRIQDQANADIQHIHDTATSTIAAIEANVHALIAQANTPP